MKGLLKLVIAVLALLGVCAILDKTLGDGPLPELQSAVHLGSNLTTATITRPTANTNHARAAALAPAIADLRATAPEIARWVVRLRDSDQILYDYCIPLDHPSDQGPLALAVPVADYLMLAPAFWEVPDIEKAAILVHEYRHSRQNPAKIILDGTSLMLSGGIILHPDDSRLEDEADLYQQAYYQAVGMDPGWLRYHLRARGF